jgi:G3E family GTPase
MPVDQTNDRRVPVTVISGFLGAGKTTLLNRLLARPEMAGAAVIINEFGEVAIDHLLVEDMPGDAVLLESGCVCCAIRGDLVDTMGRMMWQADNGELPAFDRLVVETSGIADPAPVLQTVISDPLLTPRYKLNGLVTVADAVNGLSQIETFPEAEKQAALASRLLISKTDIAEPAAAEALRRRLRALNAAAPIRDVVLGDIDCAEILGDADFDPDEAAGNLAAWLSIGAEDAGPQGDHGHHDHAHLDHGVRSFCLVREAPLPWAGVRDWLDSVTSLRGVDLLRVKGIVAVEGEDRPVIVHGVQHVFHPPRFLAAWPDGDRRSRIVCITRGIVEADMANALDAAVGNRPD